MKAVGYQKSLPIDAADSLIDFETEVPEPRGRDLRVAVKAVSVNPVDTKVRKRAEPPAGEYKILGFDAVGVVDAVGPDVTLFKKGDEVYYAGSIQRQGTNSEFHLVDERIVGHKPKSLSIAQAAALPLTSITAWELLFDRLAVAPGKKIEPRWLRPTKGTADSLVRVAEDEIADARRRAPGLPVILNAMFHNVEITPNTSPYADNELSARAILDRLGALLAFAKKESIAVVGLGDVPEIVGM